MNDLRTAAQQALEFCEFLWREVVLNDWAEGQREAAEAALKAALAEPVQEPDSPERRCGGPGCDMKCCQPVAQRGAMFHTHPAVELQRSVESAVRPACAVDPAAKAQPVQEPVADRAAFERHAERLGYSVDPDTREGREGGYWSSHTQLMWLTWQAALAEPVQDHLRDATKMVQEPVAREQVLIKSIEFQKAETQRYFELYNRACETAQLRLREIANLESRLAADAQPVLTVDALRVEFERRYRGNFGITRVEGGAYLSPAIETEWQQFVRKHTTPPQRPAEPVQGAVAWMRVIDEAMVTHHLGVADPGDDYETAKRKMNNLLCMAQDIGNYFAKQAEPAREPAAAERDRLLSLAKRRAGQEASAAAHHAGRWHAAHEHHLTRHAAMLDLIGALAETATENSSEVEPAAEGGTPSWGIDWGRDGDKVCVSITKMLPNGSIEIVHTQYEPPGWRQQKTD